MTLMDSPNSHMKKKVDDDGQGQRAGRDERQAPVAEEDEQHENRETAADQNRVAHVVDRGRDKLREVVGLDESQALGQ